MKSSNQIANYITCMGFYKNDEDISYSYMVSHSSYINYENNVLHDVNTITTDEGEHILYLVQEHLYYQIFQNFINKRNPFISRIKNESYRL